LGKKLSDLVIMSDVDGTILDESGNIPKRNIAALERFTAAGGRFAVATGRSIRSARPVIQFLPVNYPCVLFNGGAVYDYEGKRYLDQVFLPDAAKEKYFTKIRQVFPECGVIYAGDTYIDIDGLTRRNHNWWIVRYPESRVHTAKLGEITGPAYKAMLVLTPGKFGQLQEYLREHAAFFEGVRFVFSGSTMFEMLPELSSKGHSIERLAAITGVARENIVAVGDYHNDLEMLEFAGLSAAPADAHKDIVAAADLTLCPSSEGSLADLVEYLEERYG